MTNDTFRGPENGLDFRYAQDLATRLGILPGQGVTIGHFDEGWELDHPAFDWMSDTSSRMEFIGSPPIRQGRFEHGNAVLGLHMGLNSDLSGDSVLLPGARHLLIQSRDSESASSTKQLRAAIEMLARRLPAVLLIARDWSSRAPHLPLELKPGVGAILEEATRRGIIVVEAAGNAGLDIDDLVVRQGASVQRQVTFRHDPWIDEGDLIDSAFQVETGAIIVGACTEVRPHQRWATGFATNPQPRSNFGSRIDCWAHGEKLSTASISPRMTNDFGGTSGAAAIVAAGIAVLQSIALVVLPAGSTLSSDLIRAIVREPEYGYPVLDGESTIGSVPNLRAIADDLVGGSLNRRSGGDNYGD